MEIDPRRLLAQLAVAVIAADGRIAADEVTALARLDNLGLGRLSELVEEEMRSAVQRPIDVRAACALLRERLPATGPVILAALATLAASDRDLSERELDVLGKAASELGLAPAEAQHILASVFGPLQDAAGREAAPLPRPPRQPTQPESVPPPALEPGLARALHVLGVAASADRADLDASYRRLIERYDPARVIDLGPDFATLAVRKLIEVTDSRTDTWEFAPTSIAPIGAGSRRHGMAVVGGLAHDPAGHQKNAAQHAKSRRLRRSLPDVPLGTRRWWQTM